MENSAPVSIPIDTKENWDLNEVDTLLEPLRSSYVNEQLVN